MKKELGEFTGKTVEDALQAASVATGVPAQNLEVEIIEKGKVTLFGIGSVKAKIKVFVTEEDEVIKNVTKKAEVVADGEQTDGERAIAFLEGLFPLLSVNAVPRLVKEDEKIEIDLETENSHSVIGKRGATLDALQNLAGAVANIGREEYKRVVVDCENYRQRREETLRRVAKKTAEKAVRQGRKISLEPMSAYERRIIHAALADSEDVKTNSEGKEPRRYVVVIPNELKSYNRERQDRNGYNRGGRGSRGSFNRGGDYGRERRRDGEKNTYKKPYRQYTEEEKAARSRVGEGTGMGMSSGGSSYKKNSSMVFGTFLGNSRKEDNGEN